MVAIPLILAAAAITQVSAQVCGQEGTMGCHIACGGMARVARTCSTSGDYAGPFDHDCLCASSSEFIEKSAECLECGWTLWESYGSFLSPALGECGLSTQPTGATCDEEAAETTEAAPTTTAATTTAETTEAAPTTTAETTEAAPTTTAEATEAAPTTTAETTEAAPTTTAATTTAETTEEASTSSSSSAAAPTSSAATVSTYTGAAAKLAFSGLLAGAAALLI